MRFYFVAACCQYEVSISRDTLYTPFSNVFRILTWKLKILSHRFACKKIVLPFKFMFMTSKKPNEKIVQVAIPLELYAKITQFAAESRRNLRQQILFDVEKIYFNVKLTKEYEDKFGLPLNRVKNSGTYNGPWTPETAEKSTDDFEFEL